MAPGIRNASRDRLTTALNNSVPRGDNRIQRYPLTAFLKLLTYNGYTKILGQQSLHGLLSLRKEMVSEI